MNREHPDSGFGASTSSTNPDLDEELEGPLPGLVLAWRPPGLRCDVQAPLARTIEVGRSPSCGWTVPDRKLSRAHLSITPAGRGFVVRDLESRNGVFCDGSRLDAPREVLAGAVIRAGGCLFVVIDDMRRLSAAEGGASPAMAGHFHTPAIVRDLRIAARTGRHVLLEGETGVGKELAAAELHRAWRDRGLAGELRALNAARFGDAGDAVGDLFGVAPGAFTGVVERRGALERAHGGALFIDEVHNLPPRVQRSLLRFAEDGLLRPLGTTAPGRKVDVRLILGTNRPVDDAYRRGELADDLVARCHRVAIPLLRERRADIPEIFVTVLRGAAEGEAAAEAIVAALRAQHLERLCLADLRHNVRDLQDLAAILVARVAEGETPAKAIRAALDAALGRAAPPAAEGDDKPRHSRYELHREEIIATYHEVGRNISRLEATLRERGTDVSRRWLSTYLERWGERKIKRRG